MSCFKTQEAKQCIRSILWVLPKATVTVDGEGVVAIPTVNQGVAAPNLLIYISFENYCIHPSSLLAQSQVLSFLRGCGNETRVSLAFIGEYSQN